jgi:hypothetical protein
MQVRDRWGQAAFGDWDLSTCASLRVQNVPFCLQILCNREIGWKLDSHEFR